MARRSELLGSLARAESMTFSALEVVAGCYLTGVLRASDVRGARLACGVVVLRGGDQGGGVEAQGGGLGVGGLGVGGGELGGLLGLGLDQELGQDAAGGGGGGQVAGQVVDELLEHLDRLGPVGGLA